MTTSSGDRPTDAPTTPAPGTTPTGSGPRGTEDEGAATVDRPADPSAPSPSAPSPSPSPSAPSTSAPSTSAPSTSAPSTSAPSTSAPSTSAPSPSVRGAVTGSPSGTSPTEGTARSGAYRSAFAMSSGPADTDTDSASASRGMSATDAGTSGVGPARGTGAEGDPLGSDPLVTGSATTKPEASATTDPTSAGSSSTGSTTSSPADANGDAPDRDPLVTGSAATDTARTETISTSTTDGAPAGGAEAGTTSGTEATAAEEAAAAATGSGVDDGTSTGPTTTTEPQETESVAGSGRSWLGIAGDAPSGAAVDTPSTDAATTDAPAADTGATTAGADTTSPVLDDDAPAASFPELSDPAAATAGRHAAADPTAAGRAAAADPTTDDPTAEGHGDRVGDPTPPAFTIDRHDLAQGRLGIDDVTPEVSGGRFPSKAVVGEVVPVTATVWREGHDAVAASVVWQRCSEASHANVAAKPVPCGDESPRTVRMVSAGPETDRFVGQIVPDAEGLWSFRVDAWSDPWATWRHAVEVKAAAGQGPAELANDLETGARLLERAARQIEQRFSPDTVAASAEGSTAEPAVPDPADIEGDHSGRTAPLEMPPALTLARGLHKAAGALRDDERSLPERLARALSEPVHRTMTEQPVRELVTEGVTHHVLVERVRALDGAWYEFFPRSTGGVDAEGRAVHGTFATAAQELERVAAMGFDVAYLPPIHPVGKINRKGPNNTLTPGPDDVGSPWAIGSAEGGHDAVDPNLGTLADFDAFVARAHELGLEVALDFALQCAPDHPWAATHPEWFTVRPDGTIAYAENPPKKYQDIYPVNFDTDPDGIYGEVLRVILGWIDHGVRIFRVDNPHTKPPDFWSWLIAEVHRRDPGIVFLAEAFTRPARLFGLAKLGFSQSYTYFTWRTGKDELREFFEMHRDRIDECRPNCFVNTPDILHESLQMGGPGMFALRAALAATLSPSWGVYAGFELFEWQPVRPGSEEYLDSEKYQLRPRDFAGAMAAGRSLEPWITRLNQLRRAHPALRQIRDLHFHDIDNPALLAYSKSDAVTGDTVLCVVTLNPFGAEEGTLHLDTEVLGLAPGERFAAFDEVSGQTWDWGQANYVRLEPWRDVAHVISVHRR